MGLTSNNGRQNGAHCSISVVGLKFYGVEGLGSSARCLEDLLQGGGYHRDCAVCMDG